MCIIESIGHKESGTPSTVHRFFTRKLDKEILTMTQANAQPQTLTIDLNQAHINAGLDKRDLEYLEAAPLMPKHPPLSFRGVSIE